MTFLRRKVLLIPEEVDLEVMKITILIIIKQSRMMSQKMTVLIVVIDGELSIAVIYAATFAVGAEFRPSTEVIACGMIRLHQDQICNVLIAKEYQHRKTVSINAVTEFVVSDNKC